MTSSPTTTRSRRCSCRIVEDLPHLLVGQRQADLLLAARPLDPLVASSSRCRRSRQLPGDAATDVLVGVNCFGTRHLGVAGQKI
jgi:hypothetical protein